MRRFIAALLLVLALLAPTPAHAFDGCPRSGDREYIVYYNFAGGSPKFAVRTGSAYALSWMTANLTGENRVVATPYGGRYIHNVWLRGVDAWGVTRTGSLSTNVGSTWHFFLTAEAPGKVVTWARFCVGPQYPWA